MLGFSPISATPISAQSILNYALTASGGMVGGGSDNPEGSFFRGKLLDECGRLCVAGVAESGIRVYPSITETGRRVVNLSRLVTAVGGGLGGGTTFVVRGVTYYALGGAVGGGISLPLRGVNYTSLGGALGGGDTVVIRAVLFAPDGGGVGGGAAGFNKTQSMIATGGMVGGGIAIPPRGVLLAADGGSIGGGTTEVLRAVLWTPLGGGVGGGAAGFNKTQFMIATGGMVGGGVADILLYNYFLHLNTQLDIKNPVILFSLNELNMYSTLNFPRIFCILSGPEIYFELKPESERFNIL
jgi:hypothetical protein